MKCDRCQKDFCVWTELTPVTVPNRTKKALYCKECLEIREMK